MAIRGRERPDGPNWGIVATFRRMFGKGETAEAHEDRMDDSQLADRVAEVADRVRQSEVVHCPACILGVMHVVGDVPASRAKLGSGAFQNRPTPSNRLQCDHCKHVILAKD